MAEIDDSFYKEPESAEMTFMAFSAEDTYFTWLSMYGEEEAVKRWAEWKGDKPVPVKKND